MLDKRREKEKNREDKSTLFGIALTRSLIIKQAAHLGGGVMSGCYRLSKGVKVLGSKQCLCSVGAVGCLPYNGSRCQSCCSIPNQICASCSGAVCCRDGDVGTGGSHVLWSVPRRHLTGIVTHLNSNTGRHRLVPAGCFLALKSLRSSVISQQLLRAELHILTPCHKLTWQLLHERP